MMPAVEIIKSEEGFFGFPERRRMFSNGKLHHHRYKVGQVTPKHSHNHDLIYWVKTGVCFDQRTGSVIEARSGSLVYLPAGHLHATEWLSSGLLFHIELSPGSCPSDWLHRVPQGSYRSRLERLESEFLGWDDLSPYVSEELVMNLWRNQADQSAQAPPWLSKIDSYLQELGCGEFSLDSAASLAGIHPAHLSRAYVQWRGLTLSEHARLIRLRRAAAKLKAEPKRSIGELALEFGFADQSHFGRHFNRAFGQSPASYRNR